MKNILSDEIYLHRTIPREEDIRGAYFRDQTAIIHSMAFRRLKHKTQVFFAPENDHVCTRIEHVMHVAAVATSICKGLNHYGWNLDTEMAFAIGLGHDLGHAPFGHDGEHILNAKLGGNNAFVHEVNSYRVVEHLTNNGKGLNLTYGVKDGIICHNGEKYEQFLTPFEVPNDLEKIKNRRVIPSSYEGCIIRFSDKIAYLGRDIEDAIVAKFISRNDIPVEVQKRIGNTNGEIIDYFVRDVIEASKENNKIGFSDEAFELIKILRDFNYKCIYMNESKLNYKPFAVKIINSLFDYLMDLMLKLGNDFPKYQELPLKLDHAFGNYLESMVNIYKDETDPKVAVTDYVAGMTDLYALECMKQITFPSPIFFV